MVQFSKVIINGITINDDEAGTPKTVLEWEYEKEEDEPVKEAEITALNTVFDLVEIKVGQTVEIYSSEDNITYTRLFYGTVDKVTPDGALYTITCKNEAYTLVKKSVNKIYDSNIDPSAGKLSEIADDLITTQAGMTAVIQDSGTLQIVEEFKCINTDVYERVKAIKEALQWAMYYVDETRTIRLEPKGFVSTGVTLTTSDNIVGVPSWDFDTGRMVNILRIDGATSPTDLTESGQIGVTSGYATGSILLTKTPDSTELFIDSSNPPTTQRLGGSKDASSGNYYWVDRENKKLIPVTTFTASDYAIVNYQWSAPSPIRVRNQTSIDTYGEFEDTIQLSDVTSVADAESRGQKILSKLSQPFITGNLLVKSTEAIEIGKTVSIVDNITRDDVEGEYMINKINYKYPSPVHEIEVGDKKWRLADLQESNANRLKRLEEQFVRNQDILTELIEFPQSSLTGLKKPTPRYRKVIQEDYNVANNVFIWDHPTKGIWDTSLWGTASGAEAFDSPVDIRVLQYLDTYTENFIDTIFKDTTTTATWSTSGSVSFTSGQIAQSESVDLSNGTISSVDIDITIDSGSLLIEVSADGSTFEVATNNTTHVFSQTGTDLRFRLTENNTSTADVSKVILSNYH